MFFINPWSVENSSNVVLRSEFCTSVLNKNPLEFLDWNNIRYLTELGHEIGNHTMTHCNLAKISVREYKSEILTSKKTIEDKIGVNVNHFAWPYGKLNTITSEAFSYILSSGHESIASAIRGVHKSQIELTRDFILRDQIIFKEPEYFFNFFNQKNLRSSVSCNLI